MPRGNLVQAIKQAAAEANEASKPIAIVLGTVTKAKPLEIKIDQRLILSEDFLILTKHVVDHYADITVSHSTGSGEINLGHSHGYSGTTQPATPEDHKHSSATGDTDEASLDPHSHSYSGTTAEALGGNGKHSHGYSGKKKMLLHYGLKVGESVILFRLQGGQKYVVLDRVEMPLTEGEWS